MALNLDRPAINKNICSIDSTSSFFIIVSFLLRPCRKKEILCKEATILARLKPHRNVVGLRGFSPNPKHFVLLLEYVNSGSLKLD